MEESEGSSWTWTCPRYAVEADHVRMLERAPTQERRAWIRVVAHHRRNRKWRETKTACRPPAQWYPYALLFFILLGLYVVMYWLLHRRHRSR